MAKKPDLAVNGKRRLKMLFFIQNVLLCICSFYSLKLCCLKICSKDYKKKMFALFSAHWPPFDLFWGALGRSWGALGALLGALGALLGRSWPLLDPSWPLLGRSWNGTKNHPKIDAKYDRFGPPKGSQNASKIDPKINQKSMQKTMRKKNRYRTNIRPPKRQK